MVRIRVTELRAQIDALQATVAALQAQGNGQISYGTARVPNNLASFNGKKSEDVRQWIFTIERTCQIHGHTVMDSNTVLPVIAGTSMGKSASGWYLHWSSSTPIEDQTWGMFREVALSSFEASNYQAEVRQKLRALRQVGSIEDYNGRYSELIFRVEDMSDLDQVSNYCNGHKSKTQCYVKLQNPDTLIEAKDFAVKCGSAHFGSDEKKEISKHSRGSGFKQIMNGNFKRKFETPGKFKPRSNSKETSKNPKIVCHFCKNKLAISRRTAFSSNSSKGLREMGHHVRRRGVGRG
ncbi:hypothetical protein FI667_g14472, partial [Globisporangium splendens]